MDACNPVRSVDDALARIVAAAPLAERVAHAERIVAADEHAVARAERVHEQIQSEPRIHVGPAAANSERARGSDSNSRSDFDFGLGAGSESSFNVVFDRSIQFGFGLRHLLGLGSGFELGPGFGSGPGFGHAHDLEFGPGWR